jgi:hypothetical protein
MENLCYFVNSRGILKSCNFHSLNPKSSNNNDNIYLYYMLKKMFNGMSIYICSDLLCFFVNTILPKINKKFVLVSGDSDLCVPIEALNSKQFNILLNNPFLIKWFLQNTRLQYNDKLVQLPIGLDYHSINENKECNWKMSHEGCSPKEQEIILINIKDNSKPFYERIPKIYVNFTISSDRFNDRKESLNKIPEYLLIKHMDFIKRTNNWKNITNYAFVLSPFGNGMDCHRTWETLCLGSIPIVKALNFKKMFEDLPILNVENWSDINEELLIKTIEEFKNKEFNYKKLELSYWVNQIKNTNL